MSVRDARFDNPGNPGRPGLLSSGFLSAPPHVRIGTPWFSAFISNDLASPRCHRSVSWPPTGRARAQNRAVKSLDPEHNR